MRPRPMRSLHRACEWTARQFVPHIRGDAQIALGGVGTKPWRSPEAEQELVGHDVTDRTFHKAAEAALRGAKPYRNNGFKIELAKRTLVRALQTVTASS